MTITRVCMRSPRIGGTLKRLRQNLSGLVSRIAANGEYRATELNASRHMSILVTDIVGFSDLMSIWPLETVVSNLNGYFERLSRCIYSHGGQVDKFLGDGMLAVFHSADDAVNAARAIEREVSDYNAGQATYSGCAFPTRIVVDSGLVVRTTLGFGRDREPTVLGPVVNVASHLAKTLPPGRVFISHDTYCRMRNRAGLWLTVAQGMDRNGTRQAVYEVPVLDAADAA